MSDVIEVLDPEAIKAEAIEIIRIETEAIKALTAHIRRMIERLEERDRAIPEPLINEEWDGIDSYVTKVIWPHRTWTISVIPAGHNFSGDYCVVSNKGDDLGEFETMDRAIERIKDVEENH